MPKLLWLTAGLPSGQLRADAVHDSASVRFRVLMPAQALADAGMANVVANPQDTGLAATIDWSAYTALIIGKHAHLDPLVVKMQGERILAVVAAAKDRGVRTVADVCDDRFEHALLGAYWRELVSLVDEVVAGSEAMAAIVRTRTRAAVSVIGDPVAGACVAPRFAPAARRSWLRRLAGAPSRPLQLLWYGHQSNLDELRDFSPGLALWIAGPGRDAVDGVALTVMSAGGYGAEEVVAQHNTAGAALRMRFVPWSLPAQAQALADCDMVVIPATLGTSEKRIKSANRLTAALWAGRPALAHPVPSYEEFRDYTWIGVDLFCGLDTALREPGAVLRNIKAAQEIIGRRYTPDAIGRLWAAALAVSAAGGA